MAAEIGARMDRMYRYQRHVYDLTRRYYLLGRDEMLASLDLRPGERLLEVGCGTGRNLVELAARYPAAQLYGVDASAEMLKSAQASLRQAGVDYRVHVGLALAEAFDRRAVFSQTRPFDRVLFSYSLSMIDAWRGALACAMENLGPGGAIHVVDFGDASGLPSWLRGPLAGWLGLWGVHLGSEVLQHCTRLAAELGAEIECKRLLGGYAYLMTLWLGQAPGAAERVGARAGSGAAP